MAINAFQFGFEGDDIEKDLAEKPPLQSVPEKSRADQEIPQNDPETHSLENLVCENFASSFLLLLHLRHQPLS